MSGAELIGIISGIVAILDAAVKVCGAVKDASGFPPIFRAAAQRLPLVMDTLRAVRDGLAPTVDQASYTSMMLVLEGCEKKVYSLHKTLELVTSTPGTPTPRRVATTLRTLGKGKKVESLMKGIVEDIQLLAGSHAVNAPTRAQIRDLTKAVEQGSSTTSEAVIRRHSTRLSIVNYGPGPQSTHNGTGHQTINTGEAPQFFGTFTGSFDFSPPRTPLAHQEIPPPPWTP